VDAPPTTTDALRAVYLDEWQQDEDTWPRDDFPPDPNDPAGPDPRTWRTRQLSRDELSRHIGDLADALGWRHHQSWSPGLTTLGYADGFPTHVLLRGPRLLVVTVLSENASMTSNEAAWHNELRGVAEVLIVRGDLEALGKTLHGETTASEHEMADHAA
jgi:hypothetical protein